jgi:MEKHLA domain
MAPVGRVDDINEWILWSSNSLAQAHNQSLLEMMKVDSIEQVHTHKRYAVLSHGTQDDPIFCYSNVAARDAFQYTEHEFYQLPSRYSAPGGGDRQSRQKIMEDADNANYWIIPHGIRQRKDDSLFEFRDVILWNVYNPQGVRVGQSAVYDQDKVANVESHP